jgi:hypothetical protein
MQAVTSAATALTFPAVMLAKQSLMLYLVSSSATSFLILQGWPRLSRALPGRTRCTDRERSATISTTGREGDTSAASSGSQEVDTSASPFTPPQHLDDFLNEALLRYGKDDKGMGCCNEESVDDPCTLSAAFVFCCGSRWSRKAALIRKRTCSGSASCAEGRPAEARGPSSTAFRCWNDPFQLRSMGSGFDAA